MARAEKEAIILILDVGKNTLKKSDDGVCFFDRAKQCATKIIQRKIFTKPNDEIGIVLLGTETKNDLNSSLSGYENIKEYEELKIPTWQMLRQFEKEVISDNTREGDWLDGLIVAMNYFQVTSTGKNFSRFKIILLTNFVTSVSSVDTEVIVTNMNQHNVELIAISDNIQYFNIDSEDANGFFSQNPTKSITQEASEKLLNDILKKTNGNLCHLDYLELQLVNFQNKTTRAMPWNCPLTIGSELKIFISLYIQVQAEKPLASFKTECSLPNTRTQAVVEYFHNNKPLNSYDLLGEGCIKGYSYGDTIVPIPAEDDDLKYKNTEKCFTCIGFTNKNKIWNEHRIGDNTSICVSQSENDPLFASLVKVLFEGELVMVVRRVYRNGLNPTINVLIPSYTEDIPHFLMMLLQFSEDSIYYMFPEFNSNKTKPNEEQLDAIDKLIDSMDLMNALDDDSGFPEAFSSSLTLNPTNQHLLRAVAYRALHPDEPMPTISEDLLNMISIPKKIKEISKEHMEKVAELFPLEIMQKKAKNAFSKLPVASHTLDEENEDSTVFDSRNDVIEIGTVSPAEDFSILLDKGEKFGTLCPQIQNVIYDLIFRSTSIPMEKVMQGIHMYREQAKIYAPFRYNDWILMLKNALLERNREEFWQDVIVKEQYGIISSAESINSAITDEQQQEFYQVVKKADNIQAVAMEEEDDLDALLDD